MKKSILLLSACMVCTMSYAQLKVDASGHTGIGTTDTRSLLSIGGGDSNYTVNITSPSYKGGLVINNTSATGLTIRNYYQYNGTTYGLQISPSGGYSAPTAVGAVSYVGTSYSSNMGVCGILTSIPSGSTKNVGIYGSSSPMLFMNYTGNYAGYFNGDVRATGTLYTNVVTSNYLVDENVIEESIEEEEPVLESLSQLEPIRLIDNREAEMVSVPEDIKEQLNEAGYDTPDEVEQVQTPTAKIRYALDVEALKKTYPELVYESGDGNISINYMEMVPLLVQSIKELNAKIEELNGGGSTASKNFELASGISQAEATDILSLSQNVPNPFSTATSISVNVPESTNNAAIFIYDMSGKQIKQIDINGRGKTSISVSAEGLNAGMYLYTLIADGRVISTKRMILTK